MKSHVKYLQKFDFSIPIKMSLGGLAMLCQYSDDSDLESSSDESEVVEEPVHYENLSDFIQHEVLGEILKESVRRSELAKKIKVHNTHRDSAAIVNISDSSSSAASSSDEETSSSSSSMTDSDDDTKIFKNGDSSKTNQSKPPRVRRPPKVKGEMTTADLPAIEDLHITVPEYECLEIGTIASVVDDLVVVKGAVGTAALDLDSVLFLDRGQRPLGKIFDVMGPVVQPFYCVRFNSNEHIKEKNVEVGMAVFYAPRTEHTSFIFLSELMKLKGSDASWENDHEPPEQFLDHSDDELEKGERRRKRSHNHGQDQNHQDQQRPKARAYRPPSAQAQSGNAFYRRQRHYNPRDFGPIQWNSMHTQHMPGPTVPRDPNLLPNPFALPPPPPPPPPSSEPTQYPPNPYSNSLPL